MAVHNLVQAYRYTSDKDPVIVGHAIAVLLGSPGMWVAGLVYSRLARGKMIP